MDVTKSGQQLEGQQLEQRQQQQQQQQQLQQNRYAHLVQANNGQQTETRTSITAKAASNGKVSTIATDQVPNGHQQTNHRPSHATSANQSKTNASTRATAQAGQDKPTPSIGGGVTGGSNSQQHRQHRAYARNNNYYSSFSNVDWREQWYIMKDKILEKVEEPQSQRRLILVIVCCALLLDNMLYMVIVPIIPDYLRSIGAWSTYAENAKWIRTNTTIAGAPKWQRVGGNVIYEGEDSAVGFLFASKAIVQLFVNPFSGAIIDRIGYEIPMMIGLIVMFFSTMVFACGQTYSVLFLARSLQGVGSAFADTSGLAMIADRFAEENERQRALGVALAFISFGCLVAPPFGSVLYQAAGKEVPFIILSLVCLLDGSLLLLVTPPGTFAQLMPGIFAQSYQPPPNQHSAATISKQQQQQQQLAIQQTSKQQQTPDDGGEAAQEAAAAAAEERKRAFKRQKSISRRLSITKASDGAAPKGTPIYVLFRDPCIACCSGALVVANVSLAFLEPTISIWVQNTMPDIEEWQMGMIWLPAFVPHVLGVYSTVKLADKYPRYQWLIAAIGLVLEGVSCLMVPFCSSFWSLIIPISVICFGLALIDTAILPTLGFLVDTRYVSVYGSIYAIADISYSLSYAIGPIIAGGIVEAIGFTALNFLIAIVTLGYTPILMMLRTIHDYEPFEADNSGQAKQRAKELAPFGQFGRPPRSDSPQEQHLDDIPEGVSCKPLQADEAARGIESYQHQGGEKGYDFWAAQSPGQQQQQRKTVLIKKGSIKGSRSRAEGEQAKHSGGSIKRHSVKIVESKPATEDWRSSTTIGSSTAKTNPISNPFMSEE